MTRILYREWKIGEAGREKVRRLADELHIGGLLAGVLAARGIDEPEEADSFLHQRSGLGDPLAIQDMDKAVEIICHAVEQEEYIVVFGDYDVDGITATALLYSYLDSLGAAVFYKISNRSDDGYGLSAAIVEQIAAKGVSLIVTVDNGTSAVEAAQRARELGVKMVVTDHHLAPETLPPVDALVNPCREEQSPFAGLSGAGVAFMLVAAMEGCSPEELLPMFGDLAAIGTVADVMRLTGMNRTIVREGLAQIGSTERPGLRALMESSGLGEKELTVENISFGLAPRLNAAGRMNDATDALRLLLTDDEDEAAEYAENLQEMNMIRQKTEQEMLAEISAQLEACPELCRSPVLMVSGEGWHQGVIGIVASRLMEKYAKPAVVISFDGDEGRGSGRSVPGFSLYGAIASCQDILIRYGGHDLAAGLSIQRGRLDEFRRRVGEWAAEHAPELRLPYIYADLQMDFDCLTLDEVAQLELLAPCGNGNPQPRFYVPDVLVEAVFPVGEGKHTRLRLGKGGKSVSAVLFRTGPSCLAYKPGDEVDVLLSLSVYEGRQGRQVSARVEEMRPCGMGVEHVRQSVEFTGFLSGRALNAGQKKEYCPQREETAAVYRALRDDGPFSYCDLRPLFTRLGEENTGRVLASLYALEEIGLIRRNEDTESYEIVQVKEKRDLSESTLLCRLKS